MPTDSDTGSDGGRTTLGNYIERSPFYLLFRDEDAMRVLLSAQQYGSYLTPERVAGYPYDMTEEEAADLLQFLHEIELLLEHPDTTDDTPRYEVNNAHELVRALDAPHMDRIIGDDVLAGLLDCYLGKFYLPCLTSENLQHLTDFAEADIEDANETLRTLRVIRGGMVMGGDKTTGPTVERTETLLETMTEVVDAVEDDGIDLDADGLNDILHGRAESDDTDHDDLFVLQEDELRDVVHQHASLGAPVMGATNSMFTFEGGESGHTLNKQHEASEFLYRARTELIRHCETIQDRYDSRPRHVSALEDPEINGGSDSHSGRPFTTSEEAATNAETMRDKLEYAINTYFEGNTEQFSTRFAETVLVYFDHDDTEVYDAVRETADDVLADGYTVVLEDDVEDIPPSTPDTATTRLRIVSDETSEVHKNE